MAGKKLNRQWGVALIALLCLLAAVLPLGGIPPLASRLASLLLAAVGVALALRAPRLRVALPYVVLAAWSLLQVVPLPISVVGLLSPKAAELWRDALSPIRGSITMAPLSLCPEATWLEVSKWAGLAGASLIGAATQRRAGLSRSITVGLAAALVVGAVHVVHGTLGLSKVYGVYAPTVQFTGVHVGPLLNVNHLSGYLLLGVFSGLSLVYSSRLRQSVATALVLLATSMLVVGVVLLASRSAVAALVLGTLVATGLYLARWRSEQRQISAVGAVVATVAIVGVGASLAVLGFGSEVSAGLGERNFTKMRVVGDAVSMIRDFPLFGVGRGAFSGVYHLYRTVPDDEFWTHPENIVVAFSVEWGLPITIAIVGLFVWLMLSAKLARSAARMVLLCGVATVMAQNLFDFGLEALGVGALSAYLFGVAASEGAEDKFTARAGRPLMAAALAFAVVGGAMSYGAVLPLDARHAAFEAGKARPGAVDAYLRRFPADPYFPLLGGMLVGRDDPAASLRWYNRALELAPSWGLVHLELARSLSRLGARSQALLELRTVVQSRSTVTYQACVTAVNLARDSEELLSIVPPGSPNEIDVLRALFQILPADSPRRRSVEERLLVASPCETSVIVAAANALVRDLAPGNATCAGVVREACLRDLGAMRDKLRGCPAGVGDAERLTIEISWATGDHAAALDALERTCSATAAAVECFASVASRSASIRDTTRLARVAKIVTSARCSTPEACAAAWGWAADLSRAAGDPVGAYLALQKAADARPTADALRAVADAASNAGMRDRAIVALRRLIVLAPSDDASRARLAELESARASTSALTPPPPPPRPR